jgi:nucleotide-binding universal stress UspA family protein
MRTIVIGSDGSDGATAALRWAADEAAMHGASLTALHAWNLLGQPSGVFDSAYGQEEALDALREWTGAVPNCVSVESKVVCDLPAAALVEASTAADLVVVGSRGMGGFRELLLGSVSTAVVERAQCPVAVVRDAAPLPFAPVVVGVDAGELSHRAVQWAADEARARDVPLVLVHAWMGSAPTAFGLSVPIPRADLEAAAERALTCAMASVDLHGVTVRREVVEGSAPGALVGRSADAAIVVVGSRGRRGLTSILLGSTSRSVVHHARCPVVVVH